MRVTVIIPTYNRARFLPRAVKSILRQSDAADFDILIVDDGSSDHTPELLDNLTSMHPEIRVLRQPNAGVAAARNTGLKNLLAETQIVTFLDSDDVIPADRFARDLPLFAADPALEMTYGRLLQVSALDPETLTPLPGNAVTNARWVQLSCGLFRRDLITRTGLFADDMVQAEDTDYLYRIFEEGANYAETDTISVYYMRHSDNMTNDQTQSRRYSSRALLRSIKRRRDDPWRSTKMPVFDTQTLITPTGNDNG